MNPWKENWRQPLELPPVRKTPKSQKQLQRTDGKKEKEK